MHQAIIKNATARLAKEEAYRHFLIIVLSLIFLLLVVISLALYKIRGSNRALTLQKNQIEKQQVDIRHKNDQLQNRNIKLIELNEEKKYLVNILAHDLRSPLTSVLGLTEILTSSSVSEEEKTRFLKTIKESAERMNQMISKILAKAVEDGRNRHLSKEKVNIADVISEIQSRYTPVAEGKGIRLHVEMANESDQIFTDHLLLLLTIENLVSNAIKFSPSNTTVYLSTSSDEKVIRFIITDEGPGFTDEDKLLLFNKLQTLSAKPTGHESSTGLGLSIVKKYVTDLEGTIDLESSPNEGSTFTVCIPRG